MVHFILFRRSLSDSPVDFEIKQWLKMLLQLVDITGQCPADHFKLFIDGQESVLIKYKCALELFVSDTLILY